MISTYTVAFMYCTTHGYGVLCCNKPNYDSKCEHGSDNQCALSHTGTISFNDTTLDVIENLLLAYNVKFNDGFEFHMFSSVDMSSPELDTTQAKNILNQWIQRLSPAKPKYQINAPTRFIID
jgi:hypothetical protein